MGSLVPLGVCLLLLSGGCSCEGTTPEAEGDRSAWGAGGKVCDTFEQDHLLICSEELFWELDTTTNSAHDAPVAPNLLQRDFDAEHSNQRWATDITYVWTSQSWMYLAVVMDLFSRRVVGWAMAPHLRTELALDALHMALGRRMPEPGLVHHSDRGVQYAAHAYQNVLHRHGIVCSMSRKGDCWDNAVVESFFARIKTELLHRQGWPTGRAAKDAVARYIEGWYNPHRLHSSLGYLSPNQFEQRYFLDQAQAA